MGVRLGRQRRIVPFLFRQVRIHLAQGATPLRLAIRTISNLTGAALSIRQRAAEAFTDELLNLKTQQGCCTYK